MQAMIGSRMEVDFMAPSEIADFRILRFSLQPIVENAIRHGHIKDQTLHIAVRFTVVSEEQCLLITLTNDGRPIDPSQAERLNELMRHPPDTLGTDMQGIGLVNLVKRLDLIYGHRASLSLETVQNQPQFILKLPSPVTCRTVFCGLPA